MRTRGPGCATQWICGGLGREVDLAAAADGRVREAEIPHALRERALGGAVERDREHGALLERQVGEQELRPARGVARQLAEVDGPALQRDRRAFDDVDLDRDLVARLVPGQLVARGRVVVAVLAVGVRDALHVGLEGREVEGRTRLPELPERPRLREDPFLELARLERVHPAPLDRADRRARRLGRGRLGRVGRLRARARAPDERRERGREQACAHGSIALLAAGPRYSSRPATPKIPA